MSIAPATRVGMVRPPRALVNVGVTPLRADPDDAAELVDEAQYGELVTCLADRGDWTYVQGPDLYFGWLRTASLAAVTVPPGIVIGVPLARVHAAPSRDAEVVDELPAGVPLLRHEPAAEWLAVGTDRYVSRADTVDGALLPRRYPTAADLVVTAESFLGVPYLWGGTSAHGIDCSGLTQRVYLLNGVGLDRDADQQALGGRSVDVARAGDLLFFGAERVTHTAIATGERTFIHAPQSGQSVQRGDLSDPAGPGPRLRAIRRYLP